MLAATTGRGVAGRRRRWSVATRRAQQRSRRGIAAGSSSVLQTVGYAAYLESCRSQARRRPARSRSVGHIGAGSRSTLPNRHSAIAAEALKQITELYRSKPDPQQQRRRAPGGATAKTKPLAEALKTWLEKTLAQVTGGSSVANAIRYALDRWDGLLRFLDDGRIEINSNTVERAMRPIALNRKTRYSPAATKARKTGRCWPRWLRPASCTASIREPI